MTVDVEDYFHVSAFDAVVSRDSWSTRESRVEANTDRLLDLFDAAGVRGTFFILGWVAERCPSLVQRIAARGHELASHGYHHQLLYRLTPDEFRGDVRRARALIEDVSGTRVSGYRAPSFSVVKSTLWALDVLLEEGYRYDASIFPVHHDRYGIPDAERHAHQVARAGGSLVEFPGSTVRLAGTNLPIAGGGYFRLLPYAWTRWGIRRVNRVEKKPVVFYLHPWEIDPDQPRIPVGLTTRLRHYSGLSRTEHRLARLMREFRFDSIRALLECESSLAEAPEGRRRTHAEEPA
jgi:polysaccharide deacetylase family protein (PEP-CTERM system associated)